MNEWSNKNRGKQLEKALYVYKIKVKCCNCGEYGHKSTYCTEIKGNKSYMYWKRMDTALNNVAERRSMGKNAQNVTIRFPKKRSSRRNKNTTKKNRRKGMVSLKRYILTSSSLAMMHLRAKIKQSTSKLSKCSLLTQNICHILWTAWKIINLQEVKGVVKTGNKKMMAGLLPCAWNGYQKRYGKLYPVTCTDTAYMPDLSINIFSVTGELTKLLNVRLEKKV